MGFGLGLGLGLILALDLDAALGRRRCVVGHVPRVGHRVDETGDERDVTLMVRRRRGLDHLVRVRVRVRARVRVRVGVRVRVEGEGEG